MPKTRTVAQAKLALLVWLGIRVVAWIEEVVTCAIENLLLPEVDWAAN
jgi:hypothetical protein